MSSEGEKALVFWTLDKKSSKVTREDLKTPSEWVEGRISQIRWKDGIHYEGRILRISCKYIVNVFNL